MNDVNRVRAFRLTNLPTHQLTHCLAVLVLAATVTASQQGDRSRTEALARRATERQHALQREADQLASEERTLLNDLRKLEIERQIKAEDLRRAGAAADEIAAELAATAGQIDELERQDLAERPDLRARLVEIYKLGRARYLRLLLSTADVRQFGRATRMIAALAELDRDRVVSHQRTLDSLNSARTELEERSRRGQALRADAERTQRAAIAAARARSDRIRDIDERRDLNAQLVGELQTAQQKLQLTLRDLSTGSSAAGSNRSPTFSSSTMTIASGLPRVRIVRSASRGRARSCSISQASTRS